MMAHLPDLGVHFETTEPAGIEVGLVTRSISKGCQAVSASHHAAFLLAGFYIAVVSTIYRSRYLKWYHILKCDCLIQYLLLSRLLVLPRRHREAQR
jgi:hypothetical protein